MWQQAVGRLLALIQDGSKLLRPKQVRYESRNNFRICILKGEEVCQRLRVDAHLKLELIVKFTSLQETTYSPCRSIMKKAFFLHLAYTN